MSPFQAAIASLTTGLGTEIKPAFAAAVVVALMRRVCCLVVVETGPRYILSCIRDFESAWQSGQAVTARTAKVSPVRRATC